MAPVDYEIKILEQSLAEGRFEEASHLFAKIAARHENQPPVLHRLAILAFQIGQAPAAAQLLERATVLDPSCATYWNDLAVTFSASGRADMAIAACRRAIAVDANHADAYYNLGNALSACQRVDEAIDAYEKSLALRPDYGRALNNLGNALRQVGRTTEAVACLRLGVSLQPSDAQLSNNLGVAMHAGGLSEEAIDCYRKAIELWPEYPEAYNNLGNLLREKGDLDGALDAYRRAISLRPEYAEAHSNLGLALKMAAKADEAIAASALAVALAPRFVTGYNNLGLALEENGRFEEAIDSYLHALRLEPRGTGIKLNLGRLLGELGRLDQGLAVCREVLREAPNLPEAHLNLSIILLSRGDFAEGWREHESRLQCRSLFKELKLQQPRWDGSDPSGRTILVHPEQGLGDIIQFSRFVPEAAARGAKVMLALPDPLFRLMQNLPGVSQAIRLGDPLPAFDVHCPLLSLPHALGCDRPIPPSAGHYPQGSRPARSPDAPLRIGLAWAGGPTPRHRSVKLSELQPLAGTGATFDSLQVGSAANQVREQSGWHVVDHSDELRDFADTAALIRQMDLVVSVDTAVAHLAGSLGVPTFVLLPYLSDWRWGRHRHDTPWYPNMHLIRQRLWGDWAGQVLEIIQAIENFKAHFSAVP